MILFDLSRLISRAGRETPTGIDRVELAYAEHLISGGGPLSFTMLAASGRFGLIPTETAKGYIRTVAAVWRGDLRRRGQFSGRSSSGGAPAFTHFGQARRRCKHNRPPHPRYQFTSSFLTIILKSAAPLPVCRDGLEPALSA